MAILSVHSKSPDRLDTFWVPDLGVDSYNVYVSLADKTACYKKVKNKISNIVSQQVGYNDRIQARITIAEVMAALTATGLSFDGNTVFYFRITTITGSTESELSNAATKTVYPVGIGDQPGLDNEVSNSQDYGFSQELQRWVRMAATKSGALNIFDNPFHAPNLTVDKTYTSVGGEDVVQTELWYYTGTPTGGKAKLVTYTYGSDPVPTKIVWSDSTVT